MLPVLALVGQPNVGKSTLFNRLTRTRDALVADYPGLTRDRRYGIGRIGPAPYLIVDTGGLTLESTGLDVVTQRQVALALDEADHLLFLVDASAGCSSADLDLAARLRRRGKPITLAANKMDRADPHAAAADFYDLALGEPIPISASQGRGLAKLIDRVFQALPEAACAAVDSLGVEQAGVRIAVVGRPNVGKSTLINRLLGEERLVTFDAPGTTRDSIAVPFERDGKPYTLIDTAGVRRRAKVFEAVEKFSVVKTLQAIEESNLVVLLLDAQQGITEQDCTLAAHILESGRALVVAVNKWDGLAAEDRAKVKDAFTRKLGFLDFAGVHYVSALYGGGVAGLLDAADTAFANAIRDLGTPLLTRILEGAVRAHQPPLVRGRRIKLRYAHQGGRNPPVIVVHGNQTERLPTSYRRYLVNRFRQELELTGTPLRLELRTGSNPYQGHRNRLSAAQLRKRARIKRFVKG
jgi:GTP-binding protein